tara:strand:+ start:378 stop:920 length:543 start_codon:yes stop_codon:yes gene_type:complete
MVDKVIPQEQMKLFNRPKEMAEPMPEEMMAEEPQVEMSDTGLRRDDPKIALGSLAVFLIDLRPDKIKAMKSFIMDFPLVTEAVSETLQIAPEELNDLFDASLGDPEANRRMIQKFGGEEAMVGEEAMLREQEMPLQREQPSITPRPRETMGTRQASPMATQTEAPPVPMERGRRGLASPQ